MNARATFLLLVSLAPSSLLAGTVTVKPSSLSFGNQVQKTSSATKLVRLTNGLTTPLTITSISSNLADYAQTNTCPLSPATLGAGASCTISVTFTPSALGSRVATLSVTDNASNSPQKVSLSGTGVAPVTATPSSLAFGGQAVGVKSAARMVTVKNNQKTSLTITSIASNVTDYSTTTTCPLNPRTLAAGASCSVSVFFAPATIGLRSAVLTVADNAAVSPTVSLSGTGISVTAVSITPESPSICPGQSQQFTATATFNDGSTQDITSSAAWTSSKTAIATVNSGGLAASSISTGSTTISASYSGVSNSAPLSVVLGQQFTYVFAVFPPVSGSNNTHFMDHVINQPSIDGVTVISNWTKAETGTPGPNTCSPVGTDTCQMDAYGWTHKYNWSSIDSTNAQFFAAAGGTKKVNILLFGISGPGPNCMLNNSCINASTPYYVTTPSWTSHVAATGQDVINANKDNCPNWYGLFPTKMSRDANGLVTVTEGQHGYNNGDTIWIGGTTPNDFNIAQASVTAVQQVGATSILTITAANSYPAGMTVTFNGLQNATFLNGQTVTVSSSTPTQFTASFAHADYGPTSESAATASPGGVQVQGVTSSTFQYQSGTHSAGAATSVGTIQSIAQSWPVPYELPYKEAWKPFVAAGILHYANNPQVAYMRIGKSAGAEAYPYCTSTLQKLPAPNAYTKQGWLNYYTEIDDFVQAQNPTMQIMEPLNEAEDPKDVTYGTSEAAIAVGHVNSLGNPNGFGAQGLQASDISNYTNQVLCTSDWCGTFNTYSTTLYPLELQQYDISDPTGLNSSSHTQDLRPLLPFAVGRHMTILELYSYDALLAFDPNYCVLTVPDTGVCTTGSVSIPAVVFPAANQYPYFQAVGQPGQQGATGDGSYATSVNATRGPH